MLLTARTGGYSRLPIRNNRHNHTGSSAAFQDELHLFLSPAGELFASVVPFLAVFPKETGCTQLHRLSVSP